MDGCCGELEGVRTKKGAGVEHAVISSGLWMASQLRRGDDFSELEEKSAPLFTTPITVLGMYRGAHLSANPEKNLEGAEYPHSPSGPAPG